MFLLPHCPCSASRHRYLHSIYLAKNTLISRSKTSKTLAFKRGKPIRINLGTTKVCTSHECSAMAFCPSGCASITATTVQPPDSHNQQAAVGQISTGQAEDPATGENIDDVDKGMQEPPEEKSSGRKTLTAHLSKRLQHHASGDSELDVFRRESSA